MRRLRAAARITAYLALLLLAAVWTTGGVLSLSAPLLDLGRPQAGDVLVALARLLALSPEGLMTLAHALAGIKLMLGVYLLMTVAAAVYDWAARGASDDAMLDVGAFLSALTSLVAAVPFAGQGGVLLQATLGEILLCVIASGLALWGRGPARPAPASRAAALEAARSM